MVNYLKKIKSEELDISHQKEKSLAWTGTEDQNRQRVVVSAAAEKEQEDWSGHLQAAVALTPVPIV
jgi:hypothetical protein